MHRKPKRDIRRRNKTPFRLVAICPSDGIERNVTTMPSRAGQKDNYVRVRERSSGDPLAREDFHEWLEDRQC